VVKINFYGGRKSISTLVKSNFSPVTLDYAEFARARPPPVSTSVIPTLLPCFFAMVLSYCLFYSLETTTILLVAIVLIGMKERIIDMY